MGDSPRASIDYAFAGKRGSEQEILCQALANIGVERTRQQKGKPEESYIADLARARRG